MVKKGDYNCVTLAIILLAVSVADF